MTLSARRARWIVIITLLLLCICAVRLFDIQIIQAKTLATEGQIVRTQVSEVPAQRGTIIDATGTVLADSVQTYHIAANQQNIARWIHYETVDGKRTQKIQGRGPAEAARLLAPLLDIDEATLGGQLVGDSTYVYLKKNVSAQTYKDIRALDIHGIEWEAVTDRVYPNGNTAAPVIGTINAEGKGASGLEATMDSLLEGVAGKEAYEIAPNGAVMPGGKKVIEEPMNGATIRTTLHADLQHLVQEKLDDRVRKHQAEWGAVVVTEVSSGRVLVLADSFSEAPNKSKVQPISAVQYAFEPGSVGKVVTMAQAIEKGTSTPTSVYEVASTVQLPGGDGIIKDAIPHPVLNLTSTGILARSSNVGTMQIGETLTDEERYEFMRLLGFGEVTGIELPGETTGSLRPPDQWQGRDRFVTMFGQAYSMNALQEVTLMSTIGNGGVRINPRIIDSWTLADGTVHTPQAPEPVQVISADTAAQIAKMMESVVSGEGGTGGLAKVEGYRVGIKTGTAEIFEGGTKRILSTAAGIIPADKPRLAIAVVIYNPANGLYGDSSSAPLLGDVGADAVRILGVPASAEEAQLYPSSSQ
ncbi:MULTISPECIES: peptidoglycan D,D-transpeptidase FtsI family protein [unclassified Schaalia]|uniref:peptidoglycan D,D-transpeptidase FtsI family protein n=1 Tax=unclassified Schaalia TaxID=2691889 RepID=UPI001E2E485B|nr:MULTISPECIES: penicillin-binding protein 2 [unclassified Schaalia]MCD4549238.1 penicillin-binding protein 2 [Schaalia sp. lx-260]MCD4557047.1 penicillin-binding protein 2 [Schaalia sp. lx-100]